MASRMTDASIAALKPAALRYEISDPQQRGLRVAVHPSGQRTFVVRYRYDGRSKKLTLQAGITIEQARKLAADALFEVSQGKDPAAAKAVRHGPKDTVQGVAEEFLVRHQGKLRSVTQYEKILRRLVLPELGPAANQQCETPRRVPSARQSRRRFWPTDSATHVGRGSTFVFVARGAQ